MTPITDRAAGYVVHVVGPTDYQAVPIETARELESLLEQAIDTLRCEGEYGDCGGSRKCYACELTAHYQQLKEKAK